MNLLVRVGDFDVEELLSVRVYIDLVGKDHAGVRTLKRRSLARPLTRQVLGGIGKRLPACAHNLFSGIPIKSNNLY